MPYLENVEIEKVIIPKKFYFFGIIYYNNFEVKNIKLINRKIYLNKLIDAIGTPAIQVNLILYG